MCSEGWLHNNSFPVSPAQTSGGGEGCSQCLERESSDSIHHLRAQPPAPSSSQLQGAGIAPTSSWSLGGTMSSTSGNHQGGEGTNTPMCRESPGATTTFPLLVGEGGRGPEELEISCLSSLSMSFTVSPHPTYHLSFTTKLSIPISDQPMIPASVTHLLHFQVSPFILSPMLPLMLGRSFL